MSELGAPKQGLLNIGEEAKPPFAVLPDPANLFRTRSKRFAALAPGHDLQPYLAFLARLTQAQHEIQPGLPSPALPDPDAVRQALAHGMPPLSRALLVPDDVAETTLERMLHALSAGDLAGATAAAVRAIEAASSAQRRAMMSEALREVLPAQDLAQRTLVTAGLQVHLSRLAALLSAADLKPVADGACPVCGSAPVSSAVVGWPSAHNTRFCTCSLCSTMWNVVRIKCVLCSSTAGITYHSIEGGPDAIKGETCDQCRHYVKILYQVNDAALEAFADDVASLGLDMLLAEEGWKRGGQNPFLLGY